MDCADDADFLSESRICADYTDYTDFKRLSLTQNQVILPDLHLFKNKASIFLSPVGEAFVT